MSSDFTNFVYIDIGAKRIQTWISKPLKLKYVRGASLRLSEETSNTAIHEWLKASGLERFSVAHDAGDIDGVVVLKAPAQDVSAQETIDVAHSLLAHLNQRLPSVEWEGWSVTAPNFIAAYREAETKQNPEQVYKLQPAVLEFTGARLCDGCEMELSTRRAVHVQEHLGPDCIERLNQSEEDDARREGKLRRWRYSKNQDVSTNIDGDVWPQNFEELAERRGAFASQMAVNNKGGTERPRNHIATICADGNRVGAFFTELSRHDELAEFKQHAIKWLDTATRDAVDEATIEVQADDGQTVVLRHYIGGDDVLVSVTADEAWTFAVAMIRKFETIKEKYLNELDALNPPAATRDAVKRLIDKISLGVGIAFSKHAYPFYDCREKAEQALNSAKNKTMGERSSICWMDLTEDGSESVYTKGKYHIDYITAQMQLEYPEELPFVMTLNSSAQHNLRNQWISWLREDEVINRPPTDKELQRYTKYVNAWLERIGKNDGTELGIDAVKNIEADLHRARWWPRIPTGAEQ